MNEETMQSYFEALCNAYYIAYEQVKRVRKEKDELRKTYPGDDLDEIKRLQKLRLSEQYRKKYLSPNFSQEELDKEVAELSKKSQEYWENVDKIDDKFKEWVGREISLSKSIYEAIDAVNKNKYSIVVTSMKQVVALLDFYSENLIEHYKVINIEDINELKMEEDICKEFFEAYYNDDNKKMIQTYSKYF